MTAFACHYTFNKFVLDAFLGGGRRRASTFIGLNYYGRVRFHHFRAMIPASGAPVKTLQEFGFVCDDMVERYPEVAALQGDQVSPRMSEWYRAWLGNFNDFRMRNGDESIADGQFEWPIHRPLLK